MALAMHNTIIKRSGVLRLWVLYNSESIDKKVVFMDHQKLTQYLEMLCQSGCEAVNATIVAMENNQPISHIEQLNDAERHIVLQELKSIMAVYEYSAKK
jgi:hypothetical protein